MKVAASAAVGFVIGAIAGFFGYWIVFIFTDVIDIASKSLDIEEGHIFLFGVLVCALWGSIAGVFLALIRVSKQKDKGKSEAPVSTIGHEVWPPAPTDRQ